MVHSLLTGSLITVIQKRRPFPVCFILNIRSVLCQFLAQLFIGNTSFFHCILNIRSFIGDVICRFQQKGQRMTSSMSPRAFLYLPENVFVCQKIPHLLCPDIPAFLIDLQRRYRIFDDGPKQRFRQIHPVGIHQIMQFGHQTQRLCIPLKMIKIRLHLRCQNLGQGSPFPLQKRHMNPEPVPNRRLSKMPEGRIADIVQKPRTLKNVAHIGLERRLKVFVLSVLQDLLRHILPQRFRQRGHLQRMRQSGTDKVAFIQRKDLRLVLQPPERRASDDPVVILFKFGPQIPAPRSSFIIPDAVRAQQFSPSHLPCFSVSVFLMRIFHMLFYLSCDYILPENRINGT